MNKLCILLLILAVSVTYIQVNFCFKLLEIAQWLKLHSFWVIYRRPETETGNGTSRGKVWLTMQPDLWGKGVVITEIETGGTGGMHFVGPVQGVHLPQGLPQGPANGGIDADTGNISDTTATSIGELPYVLDLHIRQFEINDPIIHCIQSPSNRLYK